MPCFTESYAEYSARSVETDQERCEKIEAMLCGIISVIRKIGSYRAVLSQVDWKKVGVNRKYFDVWREHHYLKDKKRRECEDKAKLKTKNKKIALSKLTDLEKKALDI